MAVPVHWRSVKTSGPEFARPHPLPLPLNDMNKIMPLRLPQYLPLHLPQHLPLTHQMHELQLLVIR